MPLMSILNPYNQIFIKKNNFTVFLNYGTIKSNLLGHTLYVASRKVVCIYA